ncbi:MAG TPA: RecX family transcriptional regulator [bacterium]|jgi:regulatory protein|nr:RecX family transcriptional regulator [bacterium]
MQIGRIRPAGRGGHLRAVTLADGRRFLVDAERALPLALTEGMEIEADLQARLAALAEETRARETALALLRYRPRSRTELEGRLRRRGVAPGPVDVVLAELTSSGAIDDRRFARLWIESRLAGGRSGPHRLRAELRLKGIDPAIVDETLRAALPPEQEAQLAAAAADRYLARRQSLPVEVRLRRLVGLLRRRGFSTGVIAPILRESARQVRGRRNAGSLRRRAQHEVLDTP